MKKLAWLSWKLLLLPLLLLFLILLLLLLRTLTLIAQWPLPGAPLEALDDAVFDRAQQRLVHLWHTKGKKRGFSFSSTAG